MTIKRILWCFFAVLVAELVVLVSILVWIVSGQQELAAKENIRYRAFKISDELRQSSDDLTRMARTYVATANPVFEKYFRDILDIRDGKKPRPPNYDRVYWDLVIAGEEMSGVPGPAVSLDAQMESIGLTEQELAFLQQAKSNSDKLASLENEAMNAVKGLFNENGQLVQRAPDPQLAMAIVFGDEYHAAKASIMKPVGKFLESLESRMNAIVLGQRTSLTKQLTLAGTILVLTLISFGFLGFALNRRVMKPIDLLVEQCNALGEGAIGSHVDIRSDDEVGVLAKAFNRMSKAIMDDILRRQKSEELLQESEARLNTIIDNMPAAVFLRDTDGRFMLVNRAYEEFYGVRNEVIRGKRLNDVFPSDEASKFASHDLKVIESGTLVEEETTADTESGEIILSSCKFPIMDDNGEVAGICGLEQDITEHRQAIVALEKAEIELREQSRYFQLLGQTAEHANTSTSFEQATRSLLADICSFLDWPIGHAYLRGSDGPDRLVASGIWHMRDPAKFANFRSVTEETEFKAGVGLPGRVLASGSPVWITDVTEDQNFPRAKQAVDIGVKAGLAIPIIVGSKVAAVLEFFAPWAAQPDEALLSTLTQIGVQLARVFERDRAHKALLESRQALQQNQQLLQTMLDNIPAQICLRDPEGRYEFINARYAQIYGVSKDQAAGRKIHDVLPGDVADEHLERDRDVLASRETVEDDSQIAVDGVERAFTTIRFPVFDATGQVVSVGSVSIDVTGRKRAERILVESEQRLKSILDTSPIGATIVDRDGSFAFVNSRMLEMSGMTEEEFLGTEARALYANPEERNLISRQMQDEGEFRNIELELKKTDGSTYWALVSALPIDSADGRQYSGWVYDITDRKIAEEERLRHAQKLEALGQLTGSVAHDFNNLLTVLDCNLEILKAQSDDSGQDRDLIRTCIEAVTLGSDLTGRLKAIARKGPPTSRPTEMVSLVKSCSALLRKAIGQGYSIEFNLPDRTLVTRIDPSLVQVGLLNLVGNARDAMPEGGVITIALDEAVPEPGKEVLCGKFEPKRRYALLQIIDMGVGMSPDIQGKAFGAFFTTKDEGEGTGLGLTTVRDLAESAEGFIQIESEPNKGTAIRIFLPLYEDS